MKKLLILIITLLATCSVFVPTPVFAANDPSNISDQCDKSNKNVDCIPPQKDLALNGCTTEDCDIIGKYVNPFIKFLSIFLGLAVTIGIIWGGIEYSSSGGDPQKAASGKRHIVMAIIALVAFLFLRGLLNFLIPGGV